MNLSCCSKFVPHETFVEVDLERAHIRRRSAAVRIAEREQEPSPRQFSVDLMAMGRPVVRTKCWRPGTCQEVRARCRITRNRSGDALSRQITGVSSRAPRLEKTRPRWPVAARGSARRPARTLCFSNAASGSSTPGGERQWPVSVEHLVEPGLVLPVTVDSSYCTRARSATRRRLQVDHLEAQIDVTTAQVERRRSADASSAATSAPALASSGARHRAAARALGTR